MKSWMIGKTSIRIHSMAWPYVTVKENIFLSVLKILPNVLEVEKETFLLVIVYRMSGPLGSFLDDFIFLISELPAQHRILIVGDFNLDQI